MDKDTLKFPSPKQDRRRRYDPAWKQRLVEACSEPGVSVSRLALQHGVNANLVRKWIKNARHVSVSSTSAFVPVQITAVSGKFDIEMPNAGNEEPARRAHGTRSPSKVSASLPNGVMLSLEWLASGERAFCQHHSILF
ncbi:IS66-like element accessory protein TnpA [Agrobacterium rosae]|uniref:Transposase n=1 Tax=Agrobacterium rosae TaxID=1972867 RepID=A0AAW9FJN1_9HYPH|nr:transposase [Agrobacterium rosae]MDX8305931.1 transposase [Agrobacterium rosae]